MHISLGTLIQDLPQATQEKFAEICDALLQVYHKYPAQLADSKFRAQISMVDSDLGILLGWIYENRYCTRKELKQRYTQYTLQSSKIKVTTSSPTVTKTLLTNESEILQSSKTGLEVQAKGAIYKRVLETDIKKILG